MNCLMNDHSRQRNVWYHDGKNYTCDEIYLFDLSEHFFLVAGGAFDLRLLGYSIYLCRQ